jgi:hypothetical protein
MENHEMETQGKKCGCGHHMAKPVLLLLLGLDFLLGTLGVFTNGFVQVTWPIIVILIAIMMMVGVKCKCCAAK